MARYIQKSPWDTLLFDLDGTLTDSQEGILNSIAYALQSVGYPCPARAEMKVFLGPPLIESFVGILHMDKAQADAAVTYYRERFSDVGLFENRVYDGIEELLRDLRAAGYALSVATSKPEVYTRRILDHFDLTRYFHVIAGSDIQREDETKADVIRKALRAWNLPEYGAQKTVMIGDRKHDVMGAHECGIPVIGVAYGYAPPGELSGYGAQYLAESVEKLREMLLIAG